MDKNAISLMWPIEKLRNWDKNPRTINKKDFERLKAQIQKLGTYKPLIVTEDGVVLGGNMRLKALQELKAQEVWVSVVDAPKEATKLEYALSDNDRAGDYNELELSELISLNDIDMELYKVDLGKALTLAELPSLVDPNEAEDDEAPEVEAGEADSKLGTVYKLGQHYLMCGDSTDSEQVAQLMDGDKANMVLTDPPYGISVVGKTGKIGGNSKVYKQVIGDDKPYDPKHLLELADVLFIWGANYFSNSLPLGNWVVWDKQRAEGLTFSDCELAWTNRDSVAIKMYRHTWDGFRGLEEGDARVHPTQKPIGLNAKILNDYSKAGDVILDLFGGSGSTLIACEQLDRNCYMMELDPAYCDVIRKRYAKLIDPEGWEQSWQTMTPAIQ